MRTGGRSFGDRSEQCLVAGLGEHQPAMRVLGVAQQVLAATGVVQPDDRAADERGAAEREEVVGGVVEQHRDVRRCARGQPLEEQVGKPHRLVVVLAMRPDAVTEADRGTVPDVGIGRVRTQERRGIRRDERGLPGRGDRTGLET